MEVVTQTNAVKEISFSWHVKLYKALGGEILTIGSDAHCTADIGRDISAGVEMAQAAGFKYLTYFKKHEPKFIKIEI